ncbi:unnamed protein product [Mesocestoides corti]|uniref:Frizzled-4 n=1 Tax=Mesocestoides corti TaxID=53468 RepID=A0A0R3UKZ1_MESCO|nr:unnamed protein product [Mesocestoides corti]
MHLSTITVVILLLCTVELTRSQVSHIYQSDTYGPVGQRRCYRPTRIEIPECKNRFYNFTAFPNLVGQETQMDARHQLQTFKPLITYKCSNHLAFFLCSVYAPMCDVNTNHLIGPCKPLCERVRKRCSPVLKIFNFDWPANLNCSRFPEKNTVGGTMCMEGPDVPEDFNESSGKTSGVDSISNEEIVQSPVRAESQPNEGAQRTDQSVDGLLRHLEDLPEGIGDKGNGIAKLGPHIQAWLARLHQDPLPVNLGTEETPIALLVSSIRYCSHLIKPTSYVFINRTGRCAPHCMADILFSPNAKTLATVWTSVISGLCLLATTCTLLSYAIQPSLFHTLERPVIYIAGCQLAYALGFALRLKLGRKAVTCGKDPASGFAIRLQEGLDNSNCALVFLIQYYFFTAGALWWAMMVIGWALRSALRLRLARSTATGTAGGDVFSVVRDGRRHCGSDTITGNMDALTEKHRVGGSSIRFSQFNRRLVPTNSVGSNADANCLAKEHVVAWLTPGLLTVGVLVSRQVDADELLGICSVGRQNTKAMLIFVLIPQMVFLAVGVCAFVYCIVCLVKLRRAWKQRRMAPSTTLTNLDGQSRYLVYQSDQQSDFDTTFDTSDLGNSSANCCYRCCCRSLGWDSLSTRLAFFSLLYVVPAISVLACDFYEYLYRDTWLAGDPMSALSRIIKTTQSAGRTANEEITPEVFLLRTFMSLVTGFATCLWLLSVKGIEPWRRLGRQIENRCAGHWCFSTPIKTQQQQHQQMAQLMSATVASGNVASGRQSLPASSQYSKNSHSNTSTVLHPYAVYQQHCCPSSKPAGDVPDRCNYSARPPAGPGLDAGEQSSGLALSSPTQASGYYSSATTNNSLTSGSCLPPRPPPNTPPGTVHGESNPGSSTAGSWWKTTQQTSSSGARGQKYQQPHQPSGSGQHAIL